jgi:hypothetical protein
LEDADQEIIENIDGWRGDPAFRRSMEFFVKFRTNEEYVWLPWSEDFADSVPNSIANGMSLFANFL